MKFTTIYKDNQKEFVTLDAFLEYLRESKETESNRDMLEESYFDTEQYIKDKSFYEKATGEVLENWFDATVDEFYFYTQSGSWCYNEIAIDVKYCLENEYKSFKIGNVTITVEY